MTGLCQVYEGKDLYRQGPFEAEKRLPQIVKVDYGESITFNMQPQEHYAVDDIQVDWTSVGAADFYTFENVDQDHYLHAKFGLRTYTITATAGEGGSISPEGEVEVEHGSNQEFQITPDEGYEIEDVLVDGISVGAVPQYEFMNVTKNHAIEATFTVAYLSSIVEISGGFRHTVALDKDGNVWTWGWNEDGQLGDGTNTTRSTPVQVKGPGGVGFLSGIGAICGGLRYTVALDDNGNVWAWGQNDRGQLGDGTDTSRTTPFKVTGPEGKGFLSGITAIYAGQNHTIALDEDGNVWAWGDNWGGQLGDGTKTTRYTPVKVKSYGLDEFLSGIIAISGGRYHTVALKEDGSVWTWGWNEYGQLGDGTHTTRLKPVRVKGPGGVGYLSGIIDIAGGRDHTVALDNNGDVWTWGCNDDSQLGDGTVTPRTTPVKVKGPGGAGFLTGIVGIAAGQSHTVALKEDGSVWTWGCNEDGQLGDGTNTLRSTPVQVKGPEGIGHLSDIVKVAGDGNQSGGLHTVALDVNANVWAWGRNGVGQLGDGTFYKRNTPVKVRE